MADINILNSEQVPGESENKLNTKLLGLYTDENNNDTSLQWTPTDRFADQGSFATLLQRFNNLNSNVTTAGFPFTIINLKDGDFYHATDTSQNNYFQVDSNDSYQIKLPIGNEQYLVYEHLRLKALRQFETSIDRLQLVSYQPQNALSITEGVVRYCNGFSGLDATVGVEKGLGIFGICSPPKDQNNGLVQFGIKPQTGSTFSMTTGNYLVISGWRIGYIPALT